MFALRFAAYILGYYIFNRGQHYMCWPDLILRQMASAQIYAQYLSPFAKAFNLGGLLIHLLPFLHLFSLTFLLYFCFIVYG